MMRGFNVLHPMGYDAFGQPAENAAIKNKTNPDIGRINASIRCMMNSRRWVFPMIGTGSFPPVTRITINGTSGFLIKMFEQGLAYKKASSVNWCPACETTLANEEVIDGGCWRCKTAVEQKDLEQWYLKDHAIYRQAFWKI